MAEAELTFTVDGSGLDKEFMLKNRILCRQFIFIRYPIFYTLSKKKPLKTSIKNLNTQDSNTVRSEDFPLH